MMQTKPPTFKARAISRIDNQKNSVCSKVCPETITSALAVLISANNKDRAGRHRRFSPSHVDPEITPGRVIQKRPIRAVKILAAEIENHERVLAARLQTFCTKSAILSKELGCTGLLNASRSFHAMPR